MSTELKRVRLVLARSHDYPNGSARCGYEFVAPLDDSGHIDANAWKTSREKCHVRRFWDDGDERSGLLRHRPGGQEHASWIFDYDIDDDEDDEKGYRFASHAFVPGEYVTLHSGKADHTFRVVSVEEP